MTAINDTISGLTDSWNTGTTATPKILNGARETNTRRKRKKYKNVVFLYNVDTRHELVEPTHTYRDSNYTIRLMMDSTQSEAKLNSIADECRRIIGQTGITGYDNHSVRSERYFADSTKWSNTMIIQLVKYNDGI